jgi:hypothetical protein
MRAARAAPVGRPATRGSKSPSSGRRITCGAVVGKPEGADAYQTSSAACLVGVCVTRCGRPIGVRDPAQLPWARRSRASRCPSGGRSEICVPCGWQHSPSSEACSCQVRPSQHQPWLVSTCSVTAHPFSQVLLSICVYPASGDGHIPSRQDGTRLDNDDRGPRTVGCGTGLLAAHAGWSSADDGVLPRHRRSTGCYRAGGPPLPSGAALVARPRHRRWRAGQEPQWRSGRGGEGSPGNDRGQAAWDAAVQGEAGRSRRCGRNH